VSSDATPSLQVSALSEPPAAAAGPSASPVEATAAPGAPGTDSSDFSVAAVAAASRERPEDDPANLGVAEADAGEPVEAPPPQDRAASADAPVPPTLGNYEIIRLLGRGGMGAVYLARQVSLDRPVALKVMNAEWAQNASFLVRFTREAY